MKILRRKTLQDIKLIMIAQYVLLAQFEDFGYAFENLCDVAFDVFGFNGAMDIMEAADKRLRWLRGKKWGV